MWKLAKLLGIAGALALASIAPAAADTFVIVHGAFQNAAGWRQVAEELEKGGDEAILVDLPARDGDGEPHALTLEAYRDAVLEAMGGRDGVVLVGHSFGGFTISAVAEAEPNRVKRLVYVAAYVPASGESLQTLAATDKGTKFTAENFVIAKDYSTAEVLERDRVLIFANDAEPSVAQAVADALVKEPLAPLSQPIALSAKNFGRVPKAYVKTLRDHAVSPGLQDMMTRRASITDVVEIDSGHAPQATRPTELARLIAELGRK